MGIGNPGIGKGRKAIQKWLRELRGQEEEMTTALDTNVIVALWDASDSLHVAARKALDDAWSQDTLVVSGVVYAELIGAPRRTEAFVDRFCEEAGIVVEWALEEKIWRAAGSAFQGYAARRKRQGGSRPLLAGFLIGAHAVEKGYKLLTADAGLYKASFPRLTLALV
ncbi:MAG: PIN domain nuclease [Acidobacteria bacterium]|nr:MAG: PIN domain nuclease [Acidobacteriota bacterium]